MNKTLLGKILASVAMAAVDAGLVVLNPQGVVSNPQEINDILDGFLSLWVSHPASGISTPQSQPQNKPVVLPEVIAGQPPQPAARA